MEDTLHGIVTAAVGTVPGGEYARLSVMEACRTVQTRAGTADVLYWCIATSVKDRAWTRCTNNTPCG